MLWHLLLMTKSHKNVLNRINWLYMCTPNCFSLSHYINPVIGNEKNSFLRENFFCQIMQWVQVQFTCLSNLTNKSWIGCYFSWLYRWACLGQADHSFKRIAMSGNQVQVLKVIMRNQKNVFLHRLQPCTQFFSWSVYDIQVIARRSSRINSELLDNHKELLFSDAYHPNGWYTKLSSHIINERETSWQLQGKPINLCNFVWSGQHQRCPTIPALLMGDGYLEKKSRYQITPERFTNNTNTHMHIHKQHRKTFFRLQ